MGFVVSFVKYDFEWKKKTNHGWQLAQRDEQRDDRAAEQMGNIRTPLILSTLTSESVRGNSHPTGSDSGPEKNTDVRQEQKTKPHELLFFIGALYRKWKEMEHESMHSNIEVVLMWSSTLARPYMPLVLACLSTLSSQVSAGACGCVRKPAASISISERLLNFSWNVSG